MEPEGSLQRLHVPATFPYPRPDQSSPCPPPHHNTRKSILILFSHLAQEFTETYNILRMINERKPRKVKTTLRTLPLLEWFKGFRRFERTYPSNHQRSKIP